MNKLQIGKVYKFRDDLEDSKKTFSFGYKTGIFFGYTKELCPEFILNKKGCTCFVNATDDMFVEVEESDPIKKIEDEVNKIIEDTNQCPNCKTKIDTIQKYCSNCGTTVNCEIVKSSSDLEKFEQLLIIEESKNHLTHFRIFIFVINVMKLWLYGLESTENIIASMKRPMNSLYIKYLIGVNFAK